MKFNKKFLSVFFIAIFAIVLVACGGTTTEAPTTVAPTTQAPTTQAPTTQAPTTQAPTTQAPTTLPIDWATIEAALRAEYSSTLDNDDFVAVADLTLLTVIGEASITWSSANTTYLGHDGTVVRPSFATGDQTVILTATLEIGGQTHEVMFFVTIGKLDKTDQERANEVLDKVMVFPFKEKWTSADSESLELLTSATDADGVAYDVTWASSHPQYISTDGTIVQPEGEDVVVTMTATVNIGGVDFSRTKDFTVAKQAEATVVTSFAEAIALGKDAYVKIQGVTYLSSVSNGYYFTDGVNNLFVFASGLSVETGDVVDLTGIVAEYYGYAQLAGSTEKPILVTPSDAAAKEPTIVDATIEYIMANCTAETGDMKLHTMYRITGRVYYAENYTDPVYLVPSDYDFVNDFSADAKPIGAAIEIYDYSNDTLLIPFHGKEVTIVVLPLGFHSTHENHHANFIGNAEDIIVTIEDDQEAVDTALAALDYPGVIVEDTTLEFPASLFGVTLTYTSSDIAIDVTTGLVDAASQTTQITVTLTVDAERGTATGQKVFTIKVGELSVSTLAEVLAGSNNDLFKVQATIIGGGYNTYFIQDDTGALALYVATDLRTFFSENVGNVVEIVGTRSTYNGLNQISVQTATFVEAGTLWSSENVDAIELNSTTLLPYQSHLIELTAMEVVSTSTDSNGNISLVLKDLRDNTTVAARWDSRYSVPTELSTLLASLVQGDIINIQAILGWYNNPQLTISAQTVITMTTDAEKLAADAATIPATIETTSGATEMAPLVGPYGSTFVWDATEITNAGGTFDPITGEITYPDVLVDTVYTVTGTVSLGTETPIDLSLEITVLAMTDAEKLAAAIADTGIDEDCDGYQVVTLPLTGLYGTTISWVVISGEATLDVDGTTLTYAQAGAVADVVLEATFENGLESQTVQYTVTVTPVTVIDDFSAFLVMTDGINYDIADDTYVFITGTVTANSFDGLFLQDANGVGFFMYKPDSDSLMNIGDLVVYYGQVDTYNGARQLGFGADFMEVVSTGNATTPIVFTAADMVAIETADAGKLVTFTGLEVKEYLGSQIIFTVDDGVSTRDISLRYYTNFADYLPIMFQPGDVLPEVTFNIYNFRDGIAQIDMLVFAAGQPAFDALDLTVTNALAYVYDPVYDYLFETSVKTDNNIHNVYLQSVLETANPGDMYAGVMNDMARYLGALYRTTSSVVNQIEYKGVVYTWDALEPNLGSNWYNGATSLVSVIVADFMGGTLVDGVTVKLGDGTFNYYLELTFEVTMDLDQAVIDVLEDAVTYEYTPAYTYLANSVVYDDYSMYSEYYQSVLDAANPLDPMSGIMNDMARFLGAVYRVAGSNITTIVYDGVEYTWNETLGLVGSNWSYYDEVLTTDVTLVSVIVDDFQAMVLTNSVPLTFRNALGHEVAVALEFAIVAEPSPITELFFSEYAEGSSSNKWLEIYNGTGAAIDLTGYSVILYSNGSSTPSNTLNLTGTLADGDVYVITNAGADLANVIAASDVTSSVTFFNGDDAVALLKDGVVIDVIGVIGTDPGSSWVVGTGSTAEFTLVRKSSVLGPVTSFDQAEWDVYPQNTETYVGSHTVA